jgi:hypothetical protein
MPEQDETSPGAQALALITKALVGAPAAVIVNTVKIAGRLVGAVGAIPEAWIMGKAQSIKDAAAARSAIVNAVSAAAAAEAAVDAAIVRRGIETWAGELLQKQENREAVAGYIAAEAEHLRAQQQPEEAAAGSAESPDPIGDVDGDWLNVYTRFAEAASTERMQRLWARIAAGEARKPGSFSLAALRLVSELDQRTATEFTEAFSHAAGDTIIQDSAWGEGRLYLLGLRMKAAGLLLNSPSESTRTLTINQNGMGFFPCGKHVLVAEGKPGATKSIEVILLSPAAQELATLLPSADERALLRRLAERLDKAELTKVHVARVVEGKATGSEVVWSA